MACNRSSWVSEAGENSGAVLNGEKRAAVLDRRRRGRRPDQRAANERAARRRYQRHVRNLGKLRGIAAELVGVTAVMSGITTVTCRGVDGKIVAHLVTDLARRRGVGQSGRRKSPI